MATAAAKAFPAHSNADTGNEWQTALALFSDGAVFDSKKAAYMALSQYVVATGRDYIVERSCAERLVVVCGQSRVVDLRPIPPAAAAAAAFSEALEQGQLEGTASEEMSLQQQPPQPSSGTVAIAPEQCCQKATAVGHKKHRGTVKGCDNACSFYISIKMHKKTGKWHVAQHKQHTCQASAQKVCCGVICNCCW